MKPIYFLLSILVFQMTGNPVLSAQPKKLWSKIYGGNNSDVCNFIAPYNDTMLISVGKSSSTNIGGNKGVDDYLICQFKPNGDLIRLKTFGGPSSDQANAFTTLPNGNILIGGFASGKGGDVANIYALSDAWVVGYNPNNGTKLWEKNYGGTNSDLINDIFFLESGRVFFAGYTKSLDKDLVSTPTKGGNDVFISSIDENGGLIKAFTFGGTKDETAKKILRAESFGGQMLVFGESESNDMDFNGLNNGKKDVFILKINRNINKVFLTNIGGPGDDLFADAINLGDNGIIIFGTVNTVGGQVDSLKGQKDIWMAKVDKNGVFQWSKNIGGKNDETAIKAHLNANNEIILLANSSSKDQDITANYGSADVLVMKLDTSGNILWQKNYGGTGGENAGALSVLDNGSIYFAAQSFSTNNDLPSTNTAAPDFWTVKLADCSNLVPTNVNLQACTGDTLLFNGKKLYEGRNTDTIRYTTSACDSIVIITVQFSGKTSELIKDSLCNEATMTINNVIFDKSHPTDTFHLINYLGCDSLLTVDLFFATPLVVKDTMITKDNGTGSGCIRITMEGGCKPYVYEWSNGGTTSEVCNLTTGVYKVVVSDCQNCSKEFQFMVGTTVSTQNGASDFKPVIVYTENDIIIKWESEEITAASLFNVAGQKVMSLKPTANQIKIQKSALPGGVYFGDLSRKNGDHYRFQISN